MKQPVFKQLQFLVICVTLFSLLFAGCTSKTAPTATVAPTGSADKLPPVKKAQGITAEAKVIPIRNVVLSFSTPGVVDANLVKEGEAVQEGQVIARLTGKERLEAAISAAELGLINSQKSLKDLNDKAALARSNAELALAKANIALKDAKDHRERTGYRRASKETIDELRANYVLAQQAVDDAEGTYSWVQDRPEDDTNRAYALIQLSRVRKVRDRALENLNYALKLPDEQDIAEADAQLSVAEQQVADTERILNNLKNGPDPDQLAVLQAQVKNSELQLAAAKAALDDIELKSPFNGIVAKNGLEVGTYITPGVPAIEVGDLSKWKVETTDLTELDVVDIHPGDAVTVEFDAIPGVELTGKVERINSRGQNTRGDITYVVSINLDQQDDRLRWEMSAVAKFGITQ
jgi:multidrug resistance efflux pump